MFGRERASMIVEEEARSSSLGNGKRRREPAFALISANHFQPDIPCYLSGSLLSVMQH